MESLHDFKIASIVAINPLQGVSVLCVPLAYCPAAALTE
jgi:hypothetical protein